jgi:hypothetical protein
MELGDSLDWRQCERLARRQFLAAAAAYLSLLSARRATAVDEKLPPPRFLRQWGRHGKEHGELNACVGIAIGKNDEVYTSEFLNQRVQKFTPDGEFISSFPAAWAASAANPANSARPTGSRSTAATACTL